MNSSLLRILFFVILTLLITAEYSISDWGQLKEDGCPWVGRGADMCIGGSIGSEKILCADDYSYLYSSADKGSSWVKVWDEYDAGTWFPRAASCWLYGPDTIYICRYDDDYFPRITYDGGDNWVELHHGDHFLSTRVLTFLVKPEGNSADGCKAFAGCYTLHDSAGFPEPYLFRRLVCDSVWTFWPTDPDTLDDNWSGPVYDLEIDTGDVELYLAVGYDTISDINGCVAKMNVAWNQNPLPHPMTILEDVDCRSIGIDPDSSDVVYISDWRCTDGGLIWTSDNSTWDTLSNAPDSIHDILIISEGGNAPCDTIFVVTETDGVYRSVNRGSSWSQLNTGIRCNDLYRIGEDEDNYIYVTGKWSVYRMTSSGNSWTECTEGMRVPLVNGLMVDLPNIYCASDFDFVHMSTNSGSAWETKYSFDSDTSFSSSYVTIKAFDVERNGSSSRILYTAADFPSDNMADSIFKSTDGGVTWTGVYNPGTGTEGDRCNEIVINQDSPSIAYAAYDYNPSSSFAMVKTTNSGSTWSTITSGLDAADVLHIALYPGSPSDTLYVVVGDEGVYRSSNGGSNWSYKGLEGQTLFDIEVDPTDSRKVYVGGEGGVWKTVNSGTSWYQKTTGLIYGKNVLELLIHPDYPSIIFAVVVDNSNNEYLYVSLDCVEEWLDISDGLPDNFIPYFDPSTPAEPYAPLAIDPDNPDTLYLGTLEGIFKYPFIAWSGHITSNTVWDTNSVVLVPGDVTVDDSVTLTINSGAKIYLASNYDASSGGNDDEQTELIVEGKLICNGTSSDSILFTAAETDPDRGDWYGIWLDSLSVDTMKYCQVTHATYGIIASYPESTLIENCRSTENSNSGIRFRLAETYPDSMIGMVSNCEFDNNSTFGVFAARAGYFKGCNIHDNDIYGVRTEGFNTFYSDTIKDNSVYGLYRISSGADSLVNCLVIDTDSLWGIFADPPEDSNAFVVISGGAVAGSEEGGIKFVDLTSATSITSVDSINSNGNYGIYLESTPATITGVSSGDYNCISVTNQPYGIYNYMSGSEIEYVTFENEVIDFWNYASGSASPPNPNAIISNSNFDGDSIYITSNQTDSTLYAQENYFVNKQAYRISGDVDTTDALPSSPCTGGHGKQWAAYEGLPRTFALSQNYPNPFNPSTVFCTAPYKSRPLCSYIV